ncbi:hypothetical protein ACTA71_002587 [Dictyostelium dimigraforme]
MIKLYNIILQSNTNKLISTIICISLFIALHFIPTIVKIIYNIIYFTIYFLNYPLCLLTCVPLVFSHLYILICLEDLFRCLYDIIAAISQGIISFKLNLKKNNQKKRINNKKSMERIKYDTDTNYLRYLNYYNGSTYSMDDFKKTRTPYRHCLEKDSIKIACTMYT